jgi:hypothetical protein
MVSTQVRERLHVRAVINRVRRYVSGLSMPREEKDGVPSLLPRADGRRRCAPARSRFDILGPTLTIYSGREKPRAAAADYRDSTHDLPVSGNA